MTQPLADEKAIKSRSERVDRILAENEACQVANGLRRCIVEHLSDIAAEAVEWLWPDRLPLGKLTIFVGNPDIGKSFVSLDIAARLSRGGTWPDGTAGGQAADVLLVSAEDDLADTIRPRLDRHGADVDRIHAIKGIRLQRTDNGDGEPPVEWLNLVRDLDDIEAEVARYRAKLLVIDPISAYLGDVDSHKNSSVRAVLGPLADLASRRRVAVLAISHFNKNTATNNSQFRTIGSIAFTAAPRMVWGFAEHPDDDSKRVMLPIKSNIIERPTGLSYRIANGKVEWDCTPIDLPASVLTRERDERDESAADEACEFLKEVLADGEVEAKSVYVQARSAGIAEKTVKRAKKAMGVKAQKVGYGNGSRWVWSLPDGSKGAIISEGGHHSGVTPFDEVGPLRGSDASFDFGHNDGLRGEGGRNFARPSER